ncbi:MAG: hypothetical protein ACREUT_15510 [Steroidobacteraceae bacterium]
MITRSKQCWEVGSEVRVGFLTLTVRAALPTPGDYAPDAYLLSNAAGDKLYRFVPHKGLERLSQADWAALIDRSRAGDRAATAILDRASAAPAIPLGLGPLEPDLSRTLIEIARAGAGRI